MQTHMNTHSRLNPVCSTRIVPHLDFLSVCLFSCTWPSNLNKPPHIITANSVYFHVHFLETLGEIWLLEAEQVHPPRWVNRTRMLLNSGKKKKPLKERLLLIQRERGKSNISRSVLCSRKSCLVFGLCRMLFFWSAVAALWWKHFQSWYYEKKASS